MLSEEQLLEVANDGWTVIPDLLSAVEINRMIVELDVLELRLGSAVMSRRGIGEDERAQRIDNLILQGPCFRDLIVKDEFLNVQRQLLGAFPHLLESYAWITHPHEDSHTDHVELRRADAWSWHRGFRPKWGLSFDDDDPRFINTTFLRSILYLTDVGPGNGGSAVLKGSHRIEGDERNLSNSLEVVEVEAKAGSMLVFPETLVHAGVPIISEKVRYALFFGFSPPWIRANHDYFEIPPVIIESIKDETLRDILGGQKGYVGQYSTVSKQEVRNTPANGSGAKNIAAAGGVL